jgi:hypothetical protein
MTEDDFINLLPTSDRDLIKGVVLVMQSLRNMDRERVQLLLSQAKLASTVAPKEWMAGIEMMEADFTLALAFIDMAKQYDRG